MQDRIQFKEVKNEFAKFGTILILFALVLLIQFLIGITSSIILLKNILSIASISSILIFLGIIYWILVIIEVIILILIIIKINKISNLAKYQKSDRILTVFLIWFILFLFSELFYVINAFLTTYSNIISFYYIFRDIADIFQLISWIFVTSFILNTHGLFPEKFKNKFIGYLILLMIFISITITTNFIYDIRPVIILGNITFSETMILILPGLVSILLFIGYLLLGVHLADIVYSKTQNIGSSGDRGENINITPNIEDSSPKKGFCRNCGAKVTPEMKVCPECGKPID